VTFRDAALEAVNGLALVTGVAYAVLAARRNRLCWIAGGISSASVALLAALAKLPMQAGLNVFYVGMAVFGWWSWKRGTRGGELSIGAWPPALHLAAAVLLIALSFTTAHWLRPGDVAAWPLLDSLTTWFALLATWLAARAKIENWLYWVVINAVTAFLFFQQRVWGMGILSVLLVVIAVSGFAAWRQRLQVQGATA
jgi:nicotinamide mononucleotide transporter